MPFFSTSQEWVEQSALLLEAHPTTTRITTKYTTARPRRTLLKARSSKQTPAADNAQDTSVEAEVPKTEGANLPPQHPRAVLVLKAYEPSSGICLKYETDKGAEVGRLIGALGRLGKKMAALPDEEAGTEATKAEEAETVEGESPQANGTPVNPGVQQTPGQSTGQGGAGGKKKKKGKR